MIREQEDGTFRVEIDRKPFARVRRKFKSLRDAENFEKLYLSGDHIKGRGWSDETKELCRRLYVRGSALEEIMQETGVAEITLVRWRKQHQWDKYCTPDSLHVSFSRRINRLMEIDEKTPEQYAELEKLTDLFVKLSVGQSQVSIYAAQANALARGRSQFSGDLTKLVFKEFKETSEQSKPGRKPKIKNDISEITLEELDKVRKELFFEYQHLWYERKNDPKTRRNRFILKARQIGATYYFAFEALDDAIRTGDNQLFLSASRDQAEVFKAYIITFAQKYFDVELKGPAAITLSNGAELRFLSTNSRTAQSYHGHLYIDEVFWIPHFRQMWRVASAMSSHKQWRRTIFSTPSAISHQAYLKWSGEDFNTGKGEKTRVEFDISHDNLKNGWLGPDKIWRHMVTVEDAQNQGCNLFDIDELRTEYSGDDFANLFMCKFIDDSQSVFTLAALLACTVDKDEWPDYKPESARPFGNRPVALGYDPSRMRDNASRVELAVPLDFKDKWRMLSHTSHHGQNFQFQANRIKDVKDSRNVVHIGVDTTGIGRGVYELVQDFFPLVQPIHYSLEMKTNLVIKALDVIDNGRFQYLAGDHEVTRAFLMITKTTTASGVITYASNRSTETGHADLAWATMHALIYEPINHLRPKSTATFSN